MSISYLSPVLTWYVRKSEWDSTDIIIRFSAPKGSSDFKPGPNKPIKTYSRTNGARQSRRLRQVKEHGERRRINVTKLTTVKDMKIMVSFVFFFKLCEQVGLTGLFDRSMKNFSSLLFASVSSIKDKNLKIIQLQWLHSSSLQMM
jgi:hypothetical protein